MPSSISSSDKYNRAETRPIPDQPWGQALLICLVVTIAAMSWWEWRALDYGLIRGSYEGTGLWAVERRKLDREGADAIAILGSSRMLFDTNLDVWEEVTGVRPIQLANEGTSPRRFLADLADDPDFTGLIIVGVSSGLYLDPSPGYRGERLDRYREESPSHWLGQKIHNQLSDVFAFLDSFNALFYQIDFYVEFWDRDGVDRRVNREMRLGNQGPDRQLTMWKPVEDGGFFREQVLEFWQEGFSMPTVPDEVIEGAISFTIEQIAKLHTKGADVVFVYPPFGGGYMEQEIAKNRRERIWQPMVERFDALTIHFQDYPELSEGMVTPEWSHLSPQSAKDFSRALAGIVMEELERRDSPATRLFKN